MYRARRSMYLKSRFSRVNDIVTPRVTGNAVPPRNIVNFNSTLQSSNIKVPNLVNTPNRTSSIMPTATGNAWLKDPQDGTVSWRNMVQDIQLKPLEEIENASSSTSSYQKIRNIYNQISMDNGRVAMDINDDNRRFNEESEQISGHREINKMMSEDIEEFNLPGTSKGMKCKALIPNSKPFNNAQKKVTASFSEVLRGCNEISNKDKIYNNLQVKASASLPSSVYVLGNMNHSLDKEKGSKYVFDTKNPSAYEPNGISYTFGDFENFEEELPISTPIRNPRDPPCDQKQCSTKTNYEPSSSQATVGDSSQPSLEERLKQQITILKAGQLSVNQLYILDLVEDLLVQHESSLNDQKATRRVGFLDNIAKNKQLVKCLEHTNALGEDIPSYTSKSETPPQQEAADIVDDQSKLVSPLINMLVGPTEKKKKRKKKTIQSVAQALKNGEKVKVEVELQLNQRLYEIREVRPKNCIETEAPQSIYLMKEIRVVENDLYDQLAKETVNSEGESNGLHQISDEKTDRVDKILKASRPFEPKEGSDDMTNWIDEFTYAHIKNFLEEPKNEPHQRIKKDSVPQGKKSNESGSNNDCNNTGNERVSCMEKDAIAVDKPKNKKKIGKKSSHRR